MGPMDGGMNWPMDARLEGRMDEWVQGRREKWRKGSRDERKNVWKDEGKNRYMDVGRKGRTKGWKEEGIDPTGERKGPEQSNIDPRIYKKRGPKSTKVVAKSPQKGPKTKPRETTNQSSVFKTILDPSGGRFPHFCVVAGSLLEAQIEAKFVKTLMQKIVDFLIGLGSEKMRKRIPKPLQNGAQDGPKSNPEGSSRGKWEKCKNEQHYKVLARFLLPQGVENRRKNR